MTHDATFHIIRIAIQAEAFVIDLKFVTPPELTDCIKTVSIPITDLDQALDHTVQNLWRQTGDWLQHEYEQGPPFGFLKEMFDS